MAGTDLANIISQLSQYSGTLGNEALQGVAQNIDLRKQVVDATTKAANIEVDLTQYDLQQQLEMESRKKAAGQAFGSDILDPDNRVAMLAREQAAAQDEWLAKSKRSTELLDMGFFDSPLEYMVARPFTNRVIESATIAKERMIGLDKAIQGVNQGTQQTIQTQKALNTELTIQEAAAKAELVKIKADQVIAAAQIQANEAGFKDFKTVYELDRAERKFAADMQRHREDMALRRELKKKEKEGEDEQLDLYNKGAAVLNIPPITTMDSFKLALNQNRAGVDAVVTEGRGVYVNPNDPRDKAEQVASTPGESVVKLVGLKGNFYNSAERVSKLLKDQFNESNQVVRTKNSKATLGDVAVDINSKLYSTTDKDGKVTVGTLAVMSQNAEQDYNGKVNIFKAPDVNTMVTANPALAQSPAFKEIVQPAVNASGPTPTASSMIKQAQIAIREKKLTPEAAADYLSSYFTQAVTLNASTEKYSLYGIKQPMGYPVRTSSKKLDPNVDMTSKEQVARELLRDTSSQLFKLFPNIGPEATKAIGAHPVLGNLPY